jgi:drug/metabolite transporter (DMT)-like permease
MRYLLVAAMIADVALGVLLIAVSGFILQGVNNTGPTDIASAVFLLLAITACFAAPLFAAFLYRRRQPRWAVGTAVFPLVGALVAVALPPPY